MTKIKNGEYYYTYGGELLGPFIEYKGHHHNLYWTARERNSKHYSSNTYIENGCVARFDYTKRWPMDLDLYGTYFHNVLNAIE